MIRRRGQLQRVGVLLLCAAVIPSCGGNGSPAPAASSGGGGKPSVSQDGRFVVFETASSGGGSRVVIVDRVNDTSVVIDGTGLANAAVTPYGRLVAFDAVPDGGGPRQVFLKNQITGVTTLVSATPAGAAGGGDSSNPAVTDDGRFVAFQSISVDLGARSASSSSILIREVATASIRSASSEATGNDINPSFSGNGQFVAFESRPLSGTGVSTVLLWNSENNQILTVSETPSHLPANGPSGAPSANLDGRFIAFASRATNLIEAASPAVAFAGESNIFVRDVLTGTMVVANVPVVPGIPADGDSIRPSISQDGTQVTFESTATNLTADAVVPGQSNIFVRDLSRETTTLVTQPPPTEPSPPTPPPAVPTTGGNVPVTGTGTPTGTTIPVVPTGTGTTTGTGTAVVPTGTGTATGLTTGTSVAS